MAKKAAKGAAAKKKRTVSGKRGKPGKKTNQGVDPRGVAGIAVLCLGLLALFCQFIPSNGGFLNRCMLIVRGLGGMLCLLLPVVVCWAGVVLVFFGERKLSARTLILSSLIFLFVEAMFQLFRISGVNAVLAGGDVKEEELAQTALVVRPEKDETFLRKNARLTAEGALATVMRVKKRALMRETALVTGYGRIGREMTARLCALGMFVIVCARSEEQMRMAHAAGAHPVPLAQIAAACRQADVIINTIPAHVLGDAALAATARDTSIIELASAPYGLEMQKAVKLGLQVCVESGLPGRYAPLDAGEALFDALTRAMGTRKEDAQCAT